MPLFAKIGRRDNENASLALSPSLGNDQSGFYSFAKSNLIRQQRPFGQWRGEGEQGSIHLMRIHIDLRTSDGNCKFFAAIGGSPPNKIASQVF